MRRNQSGFTYMSSRLPERSAGWRDLFRVIMGTPNQTPRFKTVRQRHDELQSGFTLVELLVAVTLGALLLVGMFQMMFRTISGGGRATEQAKIKEQGDYMITALERAVRSGSSCEQPLGAGTPITINYLDPITNPAKQIEISGIGVTIDGVNLLGGDIDVDNASGDLVFVCNSTSDSFDPDSVTVSIPLKPAGAGVDYETFVTTINLRNS